MAVVFGFPDIDKTKGDLVGGKGANLGELNRIKGVQVPEGFCISVEAFNSIVGTSASIFKLLEQLSLLTADEADKIGVLSELIRREIEAVAIPHDIIAEITAFLSKYGEKNAYAIRSSATAEDLPMASFAGQQDTYLNIMGK